MISHGLKRNTKHRINSPTNPFLQFVQHIEVAIESTSPDTSGNLKRKKFQRMNQGSNFLRESFNKEENVRGPI